MRLMQTSLLHGWFPVCTAGSAFAALAFGVAWRRRPSWHWVLVATGAIVAVFAGSRVVAVESPVLGTYPASFLLWVALPLFALGAAIWQWFGVAWWRRVVAFGAVPLLVAFAGLQINAHYGYLPTVGDLLGAPLPGQVAAGALEQPTSPLTQLAGAHHHHIRLARARGPRRSLSSLHLPRAAYMTGLVAQVDIPAPISHFSARGGFVWLPPWYFTHPGAQLPVLMLLAGSPGSPADWLRAGGALQTAGAYARAHDGYAPMMVLPDANGAPFSDTECVNGPLGMAETYLTYDVPRFMEARFNAAVDPREWAIAGLSEGGTCALDLVARHPNRFRSFADFSGDAAPNLGSVARTLSLLYGGSSSDFAAHDPERWFPLDATKGVAGYFAVGTNDVSHVAVAQRLATAARNDGIPTVLNQISGGGHNFPTWAHALSDAFPWIAQRLGADGSSAIRAD
jgi:S-formylglutathione hydrolase FrmB